MLSVIKTFFHYIYWGIRRPDLIWSLFRTWIIRPPKMIFLFGVPHHTNLGDNAQTYCIIKWIKLNYPDYCVRQFSLPTISESDYKNIRKYIRNKDMIFFHSGYHLTDLYNEESVYKRIITLFPEKQITVFPQTIHYENEVNLAETAKIFNTHGRIKLMCRDELSYKIAKCSFFNCELLLMPDIVTSLIGTMSFTSPRNGVLFCLRNDKEAYYTKEQLNSLIQSFRTFHTAITDTTLNVPVEIMKKQRESILINELGKYSRYKLIITDRYHGTIFSLIAGTPVIVLGTTDHKLSSGISWFPKNFSHHVFFANDLESAKRKAFEILSNTSSSLPKLSPYFKDNFYSNLKQVLEQQ